jgi:phosphoribosyl 1,2-cyclic phosphodiesterase
MELIKTIGSGSSGNAYLINVAGLNILLECGFRYQELLIGLDFVIPDLIVCSHEHNDHAKSLKEFADNGVPVVCSDGTAKKKGLEPYQYQTSYNRDGVNIRLLNAVHDAEEPNMFLIDEIKTGKRLFFATDVSKINVIINDITILMIEANWSKETINNELIYSKRSRHTHFSLEKVISFLDSINTKSIAKIYLMHLSKENSNEEFFIKSVMEHTGIYTKIAKKGSK